MKYMNLPEESREQLITDLGSMPAFLSKSFSSLPASLRARSGPDGEFSPVEQAWHLADLEEMGFAVRIRRLRVESNPHLPDFAGDEVARQRNYKALSLRSGIEAFRKAREQNLATIREIKREEWLNRGEQEGFGQVSLCDVPSMMAEHDASHRLEILAWLGNVER